MIGKLILILVGAESFMQPVVQKKGIVPMRATVEREQMIEAEEEVSMCDTLRFMDNDEVRKIASEIGTPAYVYDVESLEARAKEALAFPNAYGITARYAMKACPNGALLKLFDKMGLHFDASSTNEAWRAMRSGIDPGRISLSTQQLDADFSQLVELGVKLNACSIEQIKAFGRQCGQVTKNLGIRFNPGLGSGGTSKTNVGGPSSSFGIWHGDIDKVQAALEEFDLVPERVHTHIGSGSDPEVWQRVAKMSLALCEKLGPSVTTLNLGGGYKVARMPTEKATDFTAVGAPVADEFKAFAEKTGTKLQLEIEPGTYLVANAGSLVCSIQDMTSTKSGSTDGSGFDFLKLDCGMTSLLRPSLYGSQHPIVVVPAAAEKDSSEETSEYVIVGHCCESGDLLTPAPDEPSILATRRTATAQPGDLAVIESVGAYCAAMATKGYNSFTEPPEILRAKDGSLHVIKHRSTLDQILQNEVPVSDISALL